MAKAGGRPQSLCRKSQTQADSQVCCRKNAFLFGLWKNPKAVAQTRKNFGRFATSFKITCNTDVDNIGTEVQHFRVSTLGVDVDLHSETMVLAVDLISEHAGDKAEQIAYLGNTGVSKTRTHVSAQIGFQGLLAGHQRKTARKLLAHKYSSIP